MKPNQIATILIVLVAAVPGGAACGRPAKADPTPQPAAITQAPLQPESEPVVEPEIMGLVEPLYVGSPRATAAPHASGRAARRLHRR